MIQLKRLCLEYIKDETLNENIKFVEQEVQYQIDENILIVGRIDLIKKEKEFGQYGNGNRVLRVKMK